MKKLYFSLFAILSFGLSFAQCANAEPLCFIEPMTGFPSTGNAGNNTEPGINYGCLSSVGSVKWVSLKVLSGGSFNVHGYEHDGNGHNLDMDYVFYGPFDAPTCGSGLTGDMIISCDFGGEYTIDINTTLEAGKYYMLALVNYSYGSGWFILNQLNQTNAAVLDCGPTEWCNVTLDVTPPCEDNPMGAHLVATSTNEYAEYSWTLNGIALPDTTNSIQGYGPGIYTVTATYNLCMTTQTAIVPEAPNFAANSAPDISICDGSIVDLTQNEPYIFGGQDLINFSINYHTTQQDAYDVANPISNPDSFNAQDNQTIFYSVENLASGSPCAEVGSFTVHLNAAPEIQSVEVTDQVVDINSTSDGLMYSLDGGPFVSSAIFYDLPLGTHQVMIQNNCGTDTAQFTINTPSAPTGDITQDFTPGATLADIQINGQNILWYVSAADLMASNPLPANTVLVDGATYYASQTINGIESPQRLAVTVSLSLGLNEHSLVNLSYEPNPVKGNLIFHNSNEIDKVQIFGISGQLLIEKKIGAISGNLDFSSYPQGIYFVKFESGSGSKTVRIIK